MSSQPPDTGAEPARSSPSKATTTHNVSIASCIDPVTAPKCDCGQTAVVRCSQTVANPNRQFFACTKNLDDPTHCMFFQWCDSAVKQKKAAPSDRTRGSKPQVLAVAGEDQVEASELQRDGSGLIKAVCQSGIGNRVVDESEKNEDPRDTDVASKRNPQCFECGQYGHLARECTFRLESLVQEVAKDEDVCFKCQKTGHWAKECPLNSVCPSLADHRRSDDGAMAGQLGTGGDVCFKCNRPGHWARECPLSQGPGASHPGSSVPDRSGKELYPCLRCGKTGHWAKECTQAWRDKPLDVSAVMAQARPTARGEPGMEPFAGVPPRNDNAETNRNANARNDDDVCFKCNQPGHWASECPMNLRTNAQVELNKRDMYPCLRCGKTGHWAKDCSQAWREEPLDVMGMNVEAVTVEKAPVVAPEGDGTEQATATASPKKSTASPKKTAGMIASGEPSVRHISAPDPLQVDLADVKELAGDESPKEALDIEPRGGKKPTAIFRSEPIPENMVSKRRSKDALEMPPPKNQCVRRNPGQFPQIEVKKLPLSMRGGGGWDVRK